MRMWRCLPFAHETYPYLLDLGEGDVQALLKPKSIVQMTGYDCDTTVKRLNTELLSFLKGECVVFFL